MTLGVASSILIAEDEAMLRTIAADTLRERGYSVMEAGDGAAALEILKSDVPVDLLISDVKMPRMTGYELVEAGLALRPRLKVMLMTGFSEAPVPAVVSEANIPILYKPFNFDDLLKCAEKMIGTDG